MCWSPDAARFLVQREAEREREREAGKQGSKKGRKKLTSRRRLLLSLSSGVALAASPLAPCDCCHHSHSGSLSPPHSSLHPPLMSTAICSAASLSLSLRFLFASRDAERPAGKPRETRRSELSLPRRRVREGKRPEAFEGKRRRLTSCWSSPVVVLSVSRLMPTFQPPLCSFVALLSSAPCDPAHPILFFSLSPSRFFASSTTAASAYYTDCVMIFLRPSSASHSGGGLRARGVRRSAGCQLLVRSTCFCSILSLHSCSSHSHSHSHHNPPLFPSLSSSCLLFSRFSRILSRSLDSCSRLCLPAQSFTSIRPDTFFHPRDACTPADAVRGSRDDGRRGKQERSISISGRSSPFDRSSFFNHFHRISLLLIPSSPAFLSLFLSLSHTQTLALPLFFRETEERRTKEREREKGRENRRERI